MLPILLMVLLALSYSFFAVQNTQPVTIRLGELILTDVPLYLVVLGSLAVGVGMGWILWDGQAAGIVPNYLP